MLSGPGGGAFCKQAQFIRRDNEFRRATIQANNKFWENPHHGLVNIFQSGRMDAYLAADLALVN